MSRGGHEVADYRTFSTRTTDDSACIAANASQTCGSGCIGSAVDPDVLTSIAASSSYALKVDELLREASSGLAGASRLKISLQHDPSMPFGIAG